MNHRIHKPKVFLSGVDTVQKTIARVVSKAPFNDDNVIVCATEYSLKVPGVGRFFASDGRYVEYSVEDDADPQWVQLYLNTQVFVALLHQRKIINFHASSFVHKGRGVMILGDTGTGKTSLTVAFTLTGAGFLSDDLTPVVFMEGLPHIWSVNRKVKLRTDSIEQLNISEESLTEAEAGTGKKYLQLQTAAEEYHQLDIILKIETGEVNEPAFLELPAAEKFALLRSEICSWEILAGMPETEAAYMQQLVQIIERVHFVRVVRPGDIRIVEMKSAVEEYLNKAIGNRQ